MTKIEKHPLVLDYLYDLLSAEERARFEREMDANISLRDEVDSLRKVLLDFRAQDHGSEPHLRLRSSTREALRKAARERAQRMSRWESGLAGLVRLFQRPVFAYAIATTACVVMIAQITLTRNGSLTATRSNDAATVAMVQSGERPQIRLRALRTQSLKESSADKERFSASKSSETARSSSFDASGVQPVSANADLEPDEDPSVAIAAQRRPIKVSHALSVAEQLEAANRQADRKNYAAALALYQNVANLAPGSFEAMIAYHKSAQVHTNLKNFHKASEIYQYMLREFEEYPKRDQVMFETARLYRNTGNFDLALATFETCGREYPNLRASIEPQVQAIRNRLALAGKSAPESLQNSVGEDGGFSAPTERAEEAAPVRVVPVGNR